MNFVFADSSQNTWDQWKDSYHKRLRLCCEDIPLPPAANILCLGCGDGTKELQFFKIRENDINLMICLDINSKAIQNLKDKLQDCPKVIAECKDMETISESFLKRLEIDVICFFGYSYKPSNLLFILLNNRVYLDFLNSGKQIFIEPALYGHVSNTDEDSNRMFLPFESSMFLYTSMLDGVFHINTYNNFLLEIRECILPEEQKQNLSKYADTRVNSKSEISRI